MATFTGADIQFSIDEPANMSTVPWTTLGSNGLLVPEEARSFLAQNAGSVSFG